MLRSRSESAVECGNGLFSGLMDVTNLLTSTKLPSGSA